MTRVLVVHHDVDIADIEVEQLRRSGYEVDQCAGPVGGNPCPVLRGERCWQVDRADVLIYDAWVSGDGRPELIDDLRAIYPDKPVMLTSGSLMVDWAEMEGPERVTPVVGPPNGHRLAAAVQAASTPAATEANAAVSAAASGRQRRAGPATLRMPTW
jgi:DNA-binding NtrC family response regulator